MKNMFKYAITCVLICALAFTGAITPVEAASIPSETNSFGSNYYIEDTNQNEPFFTSILPKIKKNIKTNNKHSINPYFDALPKANNPENFQGLGSTSYANINGKTVTAEGFYRVADDSLHDPNAGMGIMIYQCIQYKLAHPEEDVEITFSTYRTSVTAAVCVLPESKYYGYMRSLYTTNYDEHGFVRISYMLTEAARMGIKVTLINQLPSYSVKQYNPSTQKLESRSHINYETYFNKALKTDCYNSYAAGKKVSDFMDFVAVEWLDETVNMQHVKSCTVSDYLATDGKEHKYGVFFTTSNLDENDFEGKNGNGWSQTGVILTNHEPIYRITKNYNALMKKYSYQEGIYELRKQIVEKNKEQAELIRSGKESSIPKDEQIIYLGTKKDPVFKLCYTPLAGGVDTWDESNNFICDYLKKLENSEGYIELAWKEYGYEKSSLGMAVADTIERAFCNNKNKNNKLSVRVNDVDLSKVEKLKVGQDIKYCDIKNGKQHHSKDFFMSYNEDGKRHRVSIMTSCNMVMLEFHYRTNSILVIDETAATGGDFYKIMTPKYSENLISADSHTHKYGTKLTPATLSANGKKVRSCQTCGYGAETTATYYSPKTFKLSATTYTYNGSAKTPSVTVKDSKGNTLVKDTDYTVSYESGRKMPGKYAVTINFKGNYSGSKTLYFKIKPAAPTDITATKAMTKIALKWKDVPGAVGYRVYEYNNSTKEYERVGTVTDNKFTHTGLTTATEYTYRIKAYTKDGDETIVSSYSYTFVTATRPKAPTISKISSPSKGKVTVAWSNVSRETGYQLYYSTSKTGEYTKVTSTKANVLNASKTSLKSGKTYYFKVRAYKKTEGQTAASEWSEVKSVKVK